jgi:DNA mismatch endonuclease (patch repair protein)
MHKCKFGTVTPETNATFWHGKRTANVERDAKAIQALRKADWKVLITWECETKDPQGLAQRLVKFLEL